MGMDVRQQLRRVAEASSSIEHRLATRIVPFDGGTAFLDDDFPLRYDANYLSVHELRNDVDAAAFDREADRILGGAGLDHREVVVPDDGLAARLTSGFAGLGYSVEHVTVMLHDGSRPTRPRADVRTAPFDEVRPFLLEVGRRAPWATGDAAVIEMLADYRGKLERTIDCTFVVAQDGGQVASACELYFEARVAQVEDVNTLEEFRGRGLAKDCVTTAIGLAHERGADVVFIEADVDDWPRELYRRLGFVDADRYRSFVRWPARDGRARQRA